MNAGDEFEARHDHAQALRLAGRVADLPASTGLEPVKPMDTGNASPIVPTRRRYMRRDVQAEAGRE